MNIAPQDAAAIEKYLAVVGYMEHSPMGAMLDRLELFSERAAVERDPTPSDHHAHCICPECSAGITARPTLGQQPVAKDGPNDAIVDRLWPGAVLAQVGRSSKEAETALRAWFGDAGAAWSHHREGRLGALFALTESGAELVRRWQRRARGEARDKDAQAVVRDITQAPSIPDTKLLERARIEAVRLRALAEKAWNAARAARSYTR